MTQKVYIASYDRHDEILEYDATTGACKVLTRREFEGLGVPRTFGAFTREESHVLGVFASPNGPVFFVDGQRVQGRHGDISARVPAKKEGQKRSFVLANRGQPALHFEYADRPGIGTNPYDQDPEDVDLAAMIATGVKKEQFFKNYTKDWVTPSGMRSPASPLSRS